MDILRKIFGKSKSSGQNVPDLDGLETLIEYNQRWRSVRIIYFTMFLMSLGFSIVLTGVWPYLNKLDPEADKDFMGYIIAANPLGQMIFSPLFGYWGNKVGTIRLPLLCSLALFTVASGIYSSLEVFTVNRKYWMLASRFLIGISSANIAVCRSYLSAATKIKERTQAVSMVSLAQVLGFVIGPSLQAVFVGPLGDRGITLFDGFSLNMYSAAGWVNVLMGIINFSVFLPCIFHEHKIAAREAMQMQGKTSEKDVWKGLKPDYLSVWTLIIAFFVLVFNFVLLETLATLLTMEQFAWSKTTAVSHMGILMSVGALIACVTFATIGPLCRRFEERKVLIWGGFFLMIFGRIVCVPWNEPPPQMAEGNSTTIDGELLGCPTDQEWCRTTPGMTITQFVIGYGLTSVAYPIGVTLLQTIFSKILGPRPQGVWMGLMTGFGCLSRVMGPVFMSFVYVRLGTVWIFSITAAMMAVSMAWLWIVNERLIPPDFDRPSLEMQILCTLNNKTDDGALNDLEHERLRKSSR